MDRRYTCCFTGHRPKTLFLYEEEEAVFCKIRNAVEDAVAEGFTDFLCGGCVGGDFLFADAVILARGMHPEKDIQLCMCLPCRDQAEKWSRRDRDRYSAYLQVADRVVCLSEKYDSSCMLRRNRYMVDRSSLLIAAFNGTPGGTAYTLRYARRNGLRVVNLLETPAPETDQLTFL